MALYVVQPWTPGIGPVPVQVLMVWLAGLFVLLSVPGVGVRVVNAVPGPLVVSFFIILASLILNYVSHGHGELRIFQYLTGLVIAAISILLVQSAQTARWVFALIAIAAAASGSVAALQVVGLAGWSWSRTMYHFTANKVPCGLELFPVSYAFSVLPICVVYISNLLFSFGQQVKTFFSPGLLFLLASIPAAAGILLAQSRSGTLGLLAALAFIIYFARPFRGVRWSIIVPLMLLLTVYSAFISSETDPVQAGIEDKFSRVEGDNRLVQTWAVFLPEIFDAPFGHGEVSYDRMWRRLDRSSDEGLKKAFEQNNMHAPHNLVLSTSLFYGIPAAIALLHIYFYVIFSSVSAIKHLRRMKMFLECHLLTIVAAVNVALFIHSWFHNANIAGGEMRSWLWIGVNLGLIRLYQSSVKRPNAAIRGVTRAAES